MTLQAEEISPAEVHSLAVQFETAEVEDVLAWAWDRFGPRAAIGTSYQGAGLVMIHKAVQAGLPLPVFTLDTGLLFPETLELKQRLERFFEIKIESIHPEQTPEEQAREHGPELWNRAPDLCCTMRKVLPLQKKLAELSVWITGLRAEHSPERQDHSILERDEANGVIKYNPLLHWDTVAVRAYIDQHDIPYNSLHDKGFVSIGCAPCTRAIHPGEDFRAGRWWWEDNTKKECGLHAAGLHKNEL